MPSDKKALGDWGERQVASNCACPKCKRSKTMKLLPTNFKCADLVCDFCGYLAQVKTAQVADVNVMPKQLLGAAWGPQRERMEAAIFFPLFVVLKADTQKSWAIYFLSADLQTNEMFEPRRPLSETAKRAGWQGFLIRCDMVRDRFVRLR